MPSLRKGNDGLPPRPSSELADLLQHKTSFFPLETVAILQVRGVVILGFSQLGKFMVEKQPEKVDSRHPRAFEQLG